MSRGENSYYVDADRKAQHIADLRTIMAEAVQQTDMDALFEAAFRYDQSLAVGVATMRYCKQRIAELQQATGPYQRYCLCDGSDHPAAAPDVCPRHEQAMASR